EGLTSGPQAFGRQQRQLRDRAEGVQVIRRGVTIDETQRFVGQEHGKGTPRQRRRVAVAGHLHHFTVLAADSREAPAIVFENEASAERLFVGACQQFSDGNIREQQLFGARLHTVPWCSNNGARHQPQTRPGSRSIGSYEAPSSPEPLQPSLLPSTETALRMSGFARSSPAMGSPSRATRSGTVNMVNRDGSRATCTSSQSSGVETVAPGVARTEYGATIVRECPVCPVST